MEEQPSRTGKRARGTRVAPRLPPFSCSFGDVLVDCAGTYRGSNLALPCLPALQNRLANLKETDQLAPFREDICKWINNMIHPEPKLEPGTLLRDLASGTKLLDLATAIDKQEVKTREHERQAAKAGWGDKKAVSSPAARRKKPKASPNPKPKLNHPVNKPPAKAGTKAAE